MRSLFFMGRHGQTVLNESGKYRGWSNGPDAALNKDGIKSAHDQGIFLSKIGQKFSKVICSPLERATFTAAIIAGYIGIETLQTDPRLMPLNVGDLAGQSKEENPIQSYLKDKNKSFPNGETINEFEARQHSFALDLLSIIEAEKSTEDFEVLVIAHVSNVMYWWNLQTGANSDEYLGETSDIILPGGLAIITEHSTIPIFKPNEESFAEGSMNKFTLPADHQPGMRVPKGGSSCASCEYLADNKVDCRNEFFQKWNGSPKIPGPIDSYCSDWYEIKEEK